MFVGLFTYRSRIERSHADVTIFREGLQKGPQSALTTIEQGGIFIVPHLFFCGQCNSFITAQQNFLKLCSYEGHNV